MPVIHPPTRGEQRLRCAGYLFIAAVGVYSIIAPAPTVIENRLGVVAFIWSLFTLTAIPAAIAALMGRYRIEAILLPLFGSALLVAVVNAWFNTVPDDPTAFPRVCLSSALLCACGVRWSQLHRIMKAEPWITTEH